MTRIAIIGTGMSGLTLAQHLSPEFQVTLIEKSRGFGGRMATRRTDGFHFDHGAQFFTARSAEFESWLKPYIADDAVTQWTPKVITLEPGKKSYKREWFEPHYVMAPRMNAVLRQLGEKQNVHLQTEVAGLVRSNDVWHIKTSEQDTLGPFDWVVSSAPAIQSVNFMPDSFSGYEAQTNVSFQACFALMLGFSEPLQLNCDAAQVRNSQIAWLSVNSSKPGRPEAPSLLVHSSNEWADQYVDAELANVQTELLAALLDVLGEKFVSPELQSLHRWRYARTANSAGEDFLLDRQLRLAACGDWCLGERVEDAFLSGLRLAKVLNSIT